MSPHPAMRKKKTLKKVRKPMMKKRKKFRHSKNREEREKWARLLSLK